MKVESFEHLQNIVKYAVDRVTLENQKELIVTFGFDLQSRSQEVADKYFALDQERRNLIESGIQQLKNKNPEDPSVQYRSKIATHISSERI